MKPYFNFKHSLNKPFHWIDQETGEILPHIWDVIVTVINYTLRFHNLHLHWEYSKEGF